MLPKRGDTQGRFLLSLILLDLLTRDRLERDLIKASFSPAQNPAMFRPADTGLNGSGGEYPTSEVLLPLLPFIEREPAHDDLRNSSNQDDRGCVYLYGLALYIDSPIVLARKRELQQQGTVQVTTGWLTAQPVAEKIIHDQNSCQRSTEREKQLSPLALSDGIDRPKNQPRSLLGQQWSSKAEVQADVPATFDSVEKENIAARDKHTTTSVRQTTETDKSQTSMSKTSLGTSRGSRSSSTPTPPAEAVPRWGNTSDVFKDRNAPSERQ